MQMGQPGKSVDTPRDSGPLRQFILLAGVVLTLGMIGTGLWVNSEIKEVVTENAGAVTALYVDAMVAPLAQDLATAGGLTDRTRQRLEQVVTQGALSSSLSAFKLWDLAGQVVYSTRPDMVGQVAVGNPRLAVALDGQVFASLRPVPAHLDGGAAKPLMEVYSPVRSDRNGEVIGVAEFYTSAETLRADLLRSSLKSWLIVGLAGLAMFLALYTVFARSSRTILRQRRALDEQICELSDLLDRNRDLALRVDQANLRIADINERALRRLSADLHDGPAQHLAFAALRLDGVAGQEQVNEAVNDALKELRFICRGLVLPELREWSVATIIRRLVAAQEARTGGHIHLEIAPDIPDLSPGAKNCIYRFVQEALSNAARHAPMARQEVWLRKDPDGVEVGIRDSGPGFDPETETDGLGIVGLRERIAGLKGRFTLRSSPRQGTSVVMWLPTADGERET